MFDQKVAEAHLSKLLQEYDIKVIAWSKTSSGVAWWARGEIKIPKPTNSDRFAVCMHEIKHIIDGKKGKRFEQEFACDMYAREQLILLGFDGVEEWDKRTNWHILSRIAMAVNRGLHVNKIGKEIREWFKDVDFNEWGNMKVFVSHSKVEPCGYRVALTPNVTRQEIDFLLKEMGLVMEKSEADDSTYNHWMVRKNNDRFGPTFKNLAEVINYYKLRV